MTTFTEAQLKTIFDHIKLKHPSNTGNFHSSNHQKWLPYQILGGKSVKNDPQTWSSMVDKAKSDVVSEQVRECVCEIYLNIEKLSFKNQNLTSTEESK